MTNNSADSDNLLTERPWKLTMGRREEKRRKVETEKKDLASVERLSESEEDERKKFLCVFFKFHNGPLLYSLYAYVIAASDFINTPNPPPPPPPVTILEIPRHKKFPIGIACVVLDSRIYFVGGQCHFDGAYYASRKVYYLDFDTFRNKELSFTTSSSSSTLIDYDELSECSNMHVGKSNPLVMAANGKIYVLTGLICGDPNADSFGTLRDFNAAEWTLIHYFQSNWRNSAFEVYDPVTDEWTVLPLPILPTFYTGHAVIHDKIFVCCWPPRVHTFDLKTQIWKFFDGEDIARAQTYDDALAHALVSNDLVGGSLVLNDTLYAFGMCDGACPFFTYHISDNLEDTSISCVSHKLTSSFPFNRDPKSVTYALQAGFFYLGNDTFCSVVRELPHPEFEGSEQDWVVSFKPADVYFVVFQVVKERSCSGDICWNIRQSMFCKVQGIDADSGSILDFFTL